MRKLIPSLTLALLLAACATGGPADNQVGNATEATANAIANVGEDALAATANVAEDAGNAVADAAHDGWIGEWIGVEGTYLNVTRGAQPGTYVLKMQYTLDDEGTFEGKSVSEGVAFSRPDGEHILRASDGDSIGLKWLDGKKDCLIVQEGEGYCRD